MAEDSTESGGTARPVECRALIAYDAAAAAQARTGGSSETGASETTGVGSNNNDATRTGGWDNDLEYGTRKANCGFVGLSNQGATCYMNSLLQTLYMTPEFRAALYRWKYEKEEDDDCIPLQLQRLFGLLQLSSRGAVETNALTKSFGWTSSDGFQQHDVQELCKVLFDAFEREVKGTPQSTLVNDLYQGTMTNYVRCKECGAESQNVDSFLELSLVMRPFGSKEVLSSVGESLEYCLKPETLEGDNQYFCDKCQKKVDAVKGCKFSKLPYLLCFQLKRFDYDFSTFTRVKLNGEMRFPLLLDMNHYMARGGDMGTGEEDKEADSGDAVSPTAGEPEGKSCEEPTGIGGLDEGKAENGIPPLPDLVDAEGNKSPEQAREEEVAGMGEEERSFEATWDSAQVLEEKGQFMYELYGVLIHSGSALGGHYYAYIRHLEDGQWYSFNDSTVTRIDVETVKRAWGGQWAGGMGGGAAAAGSTATKRPLFKGTGYSGANAYMLMYRRIEPSRNARFPTDEEVPAHVREGVGKDEERAAKEKEEQDERLNALTLRVGTVPGQDGVQVVVSRKDTLATVREKVWKALKLDQTLPLECLRLREYVDASFNAQVKDQPLKDEEATMEKLGISPYRKLWAETRKVGQDWQPVEQAELLVHVRMYNPARDEIEVHRVVGIARKCTVGELRQKVADLFNVEPASRILLGVETPGADYWTKLIQVLGDEEASLVEDCGVTPQHKIFADVAGEGGGEKEEEKLPTAAEGAEDRKEEEEEEEEKGDATVGMRRVVQALNRETNTWVIKVGWATEDGKVPPPDRCVEMKIDRRAKLAELRAMIAEHFTLEEGEFKILTRKHQSMAEVKGGDGCVKSCSPPLFNNCTVYVVPGSPLQDGEHVFKLMHLKTKYRPGMQRSARVVRCPTCALRTPSEDKAPPNQQQDTENDRQDTENDRRDGGHTEEKGLTEAEPGLSKKGDGQEEGASTDPTPMDVEAVGEEDGPTAPPPDSGEQPAATPLSPSVPLCDFGIQKVEAMPKAEDYEERLAVIVDDSMNIADVRQKVANELKNMGLLPEGASADCVRLRDKVANRTGKIFRDPDMVRAIMSARLDDTREIALQILDAPERLHEQACNEMALVVQYWCRACNALGLRYDFPLSSAQTQLANLDRLAEQLGMHESNLRVVNITYCPDLKLCDLSKDSPFPGKPWVHHHSTPAALSFFADGDVLLCHDASEPLRPLTEDEAASVRWYEACADTLRAAKAWGGATTGATTYAWKRPAEKGVKIRTKEERMKEAEQAEAKEREKASAAAAGGGGGGGQGVPVVRVAEAGEGRMIGPRLPDEYVGGNSAVITALFDEIDAEQEEVPGLADLPTPEGERADVMETAAESAEYMGL